MTCDGCDAPFHLGCVGLTSLPVADWFCKGCGGDDCSSPCSSEPSPLEKLRLQRKAKAKAAGQNKLVQGRKRLRLGGARGG
eukprot:1157416-Pelagomonas_calceolata.AAC.1